MLREAPVGVTALFALILIAVVIGVVLPAVKLGRLRLALFVAWVGLTVVLGLVTLDVAARLDVPIWAFAVVIITFVLVSVVTWGTRVNGKAGLLMAGGLVFVVSIVFAVAVGITSRTALDGARVLASFGTGEDDRYRLAVTAKASRLSTREAVALEVRGVPLGAEVGDARQCLTVECDLLYQVRLAPDDEGKVDETVSLIVAPGRYGRVIARGAVCDKNVNKTIEAPADDLSWADADSVATTTSTTTTTSSTTTSMLASTSTTVTPPAAQEPSASPTEDQCVEKSDLSGFSLVEVVPEPVVPSLSTEVADDRRSVVVTSSTSGMPTSAWLCGVASVDGEMLVRFQQGPNRSGDAQLVMRVPLSQIPARLESSSWMSRSAQCEDDPSAASARVQFRVG